MITTRAPDGANKRSHVHTEEKPTGRATQTIMMPSAGLLAFLITFTSFNSMQTKHFLVETKDNAEAGKRRFILGTLPFPSRNPSLPFSEPFPKVFALRSGQSVWSLHQIRPAGAFFVVSVLLVLVFKKFVLFSAKI